MKGRKVMKKKLSWHFYAALIFVVSVFAAVSVYFVKKEEYACEMADLQAMRSAAMAAEALWYRELPEEAVEYWYDATSFSLVPISVPKPSACGSGTSRFGGAVKDFVDKTNGSYGYSEYEDYRDKVLHVTADNNNGVLDIAVDWVAGD